MHQRLALLPVSEAHTNIYRQYIYVVYLTNDRGQYVPEYVHLTDEHVP